MTARNVISTVGWGLFCASSWTWCIGLFLPVILIDRFGWPGFIAFAAPNVIGCAAFGYVERRSSSAGLVETHRHAMRWFSISAIAFHMFFLLIVLEFLDEGIAINMWLGVGLIAGAFCVALLLSVAPYRILMPLAAVLYFASLCVLFETGFGALESISWSGSISGGQLLWLAPVLIFGFLLCPYFDLTFHRALRESPSPHSFLIFGIAFSLMLLLTCAIWFGPEVATPVAVAHIFWQSVITMALHLREIHLQSRGRLIHPAERLAAACAPVAGLLIAMLAINLDVEREMYLRFLVFYGLVFPAYAIVFMHPRSPLRATRHSVTWFLVIVLLVALFYEFGVIHERLWLLSIPMVAAVGIILVLFIKRKEPHVQ